MFSRQKPIEAAMYDDDRDALAAEYVLGTLSAEERDQAEALLARDPGFAETVRLWEHRLGELNVMVEAVEPPADLWERIKTGIDGAERRGQAASEAVELAGMHSEPADATVSAASPSIDAEPSFQTVPDLLSDHAQTSEDSKTADPKSSDLKTADLAADLATTLLPAEPPAELDHRRPKVAAAQTATRTETTGRHQNVGAWRGLAIAASMIAVLLAAYVAIAQFAPGLVGRHPQATASAPKSASPLMAVLQQDPTAPAFLVMLDPQQRTITVRRLTVAPDSGRSYELWLYSTKLPKPASLGAVGNSEIMTRPIPQNIDVETMRGATYAVSLEPETGSATGAPTGPMLFKGQMIDAVPGSSG
jgi:anti-sigma-K factor RskA